MSDEGSTASHNSTLDMNEKSFVDEKDRAMYIQIIITVGLILGPIFLPFVLIWPDTFDWFPFAREISISVTVLFIASSVFLAYFRSK
ncbi:MAG: hypothetical protein ACW99A_00550 [Candidatus Kariarchaeaceae archaeon]|jgi:hypothetical protein